MHVVAREANIKGYDWDEFRLILANSKQQAQEEQTEQRQVKAEADAFIAGVITTGERMTEAAIEDAFPQERIHRHPRPSP